MTYDQAGIMLRASAEKWIKAGVEYVDGITYLRYITLFTTDITKSSSVVANPLSDWAIQPYPVDGPLTIRLTAEPGRNAKIHLEYKTGTKWVLFREITGWVFDAGVNFDIGVMACSPGKSSFQAEFWDIVAQDYSELMYEKGLPCGALNPNLNPAMLVGS